MRELGQDWLALTSAYTLYIDTFSIDLIQQPSHQQCHVATLSLPLYRSGLSSAVFSSCKGDVIIVYYGIY